MHRGPTYRTTRRNKNLKLNHIFIVFVLPSKLVLNIKKHGVHNIHRLAWGPYTRGSPSNCLHRLAWGPYTRGSPSNCPVCPCVKTALLHTNVKIVFNNLEGTKISINAL